MPAVKNLAPKLLPVPALPFHLSAYRRRGLAAPPVEVSPENARLPADALGTPPVVEAEPPSPTVPAVEVVPPNSLTTGGICRLRPPSPTGGGWSTSAHAKARQAANTNRGRTLPLDGNVTGAG
jgi:hypothetical protein